MAKMSQTVLAVALCAMAVHVPPARAGLHGDIVEYGETTAEQEHPTLPTLDDHSLMPRTVIEGIHFVSHASSVSAQLCLRFGVLIRLTSDAGDQLPTQLIGVVTHPRITRPDQIFSTQDSFPTPVIGDTVYVGWTFDHPWELEPGDWTIAFQYDGNAVASQTFTVTVPARTGSKCASKAVS